MFLTLKLSKNALWKYFCALIKGPNLKVPRWIARIHVPWTSEVRGCFLSRRPGSKYFRLRGLATSPFPTCQDSWHDVDAKIRTLGWQQVKYSFVPRINCSCWQGFVHLILIIRQNGGRRFSFHSFLGSPVREERYFARGRFVFELFGFPQRMGSGKMAWQTDTFPL